MEEFETASNKEHNPADNKAEEELVDQLEDFETMRENDSDNDDDFDEAQDEVEDMTEKENNYNAGKGKKILKNPSQRVISTANGERAKDKDDFGIMGKGFNNKDQGNKKVKDQLSPRDKKDEKKSKKESKAAINKDNRERNLKDMQFDPNVMITGNQLRPGEVIGNEKQKKDKNQKSIIGWFYKNKIWMYVFVLSII